MNRIIKIYDWITRNSRVSRMEYRLYTTSVFIAFLISLASIITNIFIHMPIVLNIVISFAGFMFLWFFIEARKNKRYHIFSFIIVTLLFLSVVWFMNGGVAGSVNYIFVLALLIYLTITEKEKHNIIITLMVFILVILHVLYYLKPEWVVLYESDTIRDFDLMLTFSHVLFFSTLIFKSLYKNYQNEKYIVEVQMTEIEMQNKYMKDSILYARDIQQGMLQSADKLDGLFENNFIFWRPKDIVSVDFYLFRSINNNPDRALIAVSDCTGHGVPGAFLTMLGMSYLNEVISQLDDIKPNEILNLLRQKFNQGLSQGRKASDNRDGMDMVVCLIDKKAKTLEYSGSNRSLYLIREKKIFEYKADRMPIGVHVNDKKPFTSKIIDLELNDIIYLFTDGYADQYGGANNKKFYISKFKEFILGIENFSMKEQGILIDEKFRNWKGDEEQTDDVLVVGIKPLK